MNALLFWVAAFLVAYAYGLYGACVYVLTRVRPRPARAREGYTPAVSFIIPCYREAAYIRAKIENTLSLDYPPERLEIVVIASGPDDGTLGIAAEYAARGVRTLSQPLREGKEAAMQQAAARATGEILVFTDANAVLNDGALRAMVRWFGDPAVGCVSGEKRVQGAPRGGSSGGDGEGLYWRYESALKRWDSLVGSTMGAAGELIAVRASLAARCFRERDNIIEDFVLSMRVVEAGYRVVYEPAAVAAEAASDRFEDVFERRARIAAGGLQSLWRLRSLLDPRRGVVWWQYVSHRALRWAIVPFLLPLLAALNVAEARRSALFRLLALPHAALYLAAGLGWIARAGRWGRHPLLHLPLFFTAANAAALVGCVRLVSGRQSVLWKRTRR